MRILLVLFGIILLIFTGAGEMAIFVNGTAKGLSESVSPYRSDYCFGAELGDFDAGDWNAIPTLWDAETAFDLSTITNNHEVVVARTGISNTSAGYTTITHKWYRDSDGKKLFEFSYSILPPLVVGCMLNPISVGLQAR